MGRNDPNFDDIAARARVRMAQVDAMPKDIRDLIHEFDVNPVVAAYQNGFRTVEDIRRALSRRRV